MTIGLICVVSLVAFEAMAVATAMPVVVKDLGGLAAFGWAFSAFLVAFLFATVVSGEVCDSRGPRLPMLVGIGSFATGLLVAGLASNMAVFVLGRVLQGLGAGGTVVAVYVVVGRVFDDEHRPQVFAWLSAAWVIPAIIGPVVAGALTEHASWRWVFLGVLVLALPVALLVAPSLAQLTGGTGLPVRTRRVLAALGTAVGVALLQYGGTRGDGVAVGLVIAAAALVAVTAPRLMPPGTLRAKRGLPTAVLMRGVMAAAFFGAEAFIPLALVTERGLSTTMSGLALTGAAIGWSCGAYLQGHPARHQPRWLLIGLGCSAVAVAIVIVGTTVTTSVPPWFAAVGWTFGGLGMGMGMASTSVVALGLAPVEDHGFTSAGLQVSDSLLSTLAIVVGSSILAAGHLAGGSMSPTFAGIFTVMTAIAVAGALIAPRIRLPGAGGGLGHDPGSIGRPAPLGR